MVDKFGEMAGKMKTGFYKIGKTILNLVYEQTIFSHAASFHVPQSGDDDFNLIRATAFRIAVPKPILRPKVVSSLLNEMGNHTLSVLTRCLETCDHAHEADLHLVKNTVENATVPANDDDGDDDIPWLGKYTPTSAPQAPNETEENRPQETGTGEESDPAKSTKRNKVVERRLRRDISDFDKTTKTHIPRNASRLEMMDKAKSIFGLLVDCGNHGVTLSSVLTLVLNYEACRGRFPKDSESLKILPYDKIAC